MFKLDGEFSLQAKILNIFIGGDIFCGFEAENKVGKLTHQHYLLFFSFICQSF